MPTNVDRLVHEYLSKLPPSFDWAPLLADRAAVAGARTSCQRLCRWPHLDYSELP